MTLQDLIKELTNLYAAGVPGDTKIICFAEHTEGDISVACQMDTLSISLNGNYVQLFMEGE